MSSQQVPQLGELKPLTGGPPPMRGKWGKDPKLVKPRVIRPFGPSEQATVVRDWVGSSYLWSKLTVS